MPDSATNMLESVGGFPIKDMMMRYDVFVPRLYNWCKSLGFEAGKIMPSRAFCDDESQGYPVLLISKHFGTFPFNQGRVGGIVATGLSVPHAGHGQDLVIIQASHVGYDPQAKRFGIYRRLQTTDQGCGPSCAKIFHIMKWYEEQYNFAGQHILLHQHDAQPCIIVDNQLLQAERKEGLLLHADKLIEPDGDGNYHPLTKQNNTSTFKASADFIDKVGKEAFTGKDAQPLGNRLTAEYFYFKRDISELEKKEHPLEYNLFRYMPEIVTSHSPALIAAQITTQIEFDQTCRSIAKDQGYQGKKILFISGLNIDLSPREGQLFPQSQFVPWAAYIQEKDGSSRTMEQKDVYQVLEQQSINNPDQIDLEAAINLTTETEELKIEL